MTDLDAEAVRAGLQVRRTLLRSWLLVRTGLLLCCCWAVAMPP